MGTAASSSKVAPQPSQEHPPAHTGDASDAQPHKGKRPKPKFVSILERDESFQVRPKLHQPPSAATSTSSFGSPTSDRPDEAAKRVSNVSSTASCSRSGVSGSGPPGATPTFASGSGSGVAFAFAPNDPDPRALMQNGPERDNAKAQMHGGGGGFSAHSPPPKPLLLDSLRAPRYNNSDDDDEELEAGRRGANAQGRSEWSPSASALYPRSDKRAEATKRTPDARDQDGANVGALLDLEGVPFINSVAETPLWVDRRRSSDVRSCNSALGSGSGRRQDESFLLSPLDSKRDEGPPEVVSAVTFARLEDVASASEGLLGAMIKTDGSNSLSISGSGSSSLVSASGAAKTLRPVTDGDVSSRETALHELKKAASYSASPASRQLGPKHQKPPKKLQPPPEALSSSSPTTTTTTTISTTRVLVSGADGVEGILLHSDSGSSQSSSPRGSGRDSPLVVPQRAASSIARLQPTHFSGDSSIRSVSPNNTSATGRSPKKVIFTHVEANGPEGGGASAVVSVIGSAESSGAQTPLGLDGGPSFEVATGSGNSSGTAAMPPAGAIAQETLPFYLSHSQSMATPRSPRVVSQQQSILDFANGV